MYSKELKVTKVFNLDFELERLVIYKKNGRKFLGNKKKWKLWVNFIVDGISVADADYIRIQWGPWFWIRIQEGKNDPQK
jgi:hypothetical protein